MHIGSGIRFEVDSAINAMVQLTSEFPNELLPLCPYINGTFFCYIDISHVNGL